ncbi:hypothetical protein SCLCIDRAFT_960936 [Scleroderma citrinum Foug A]|uniref:Uncharacterized protein n=1 Tax=Scleroderma citrinum Foug A TaxID=1036808 RepID=A0A0C3DVT9_9AGAM|nr:hypothetical protein SCLCIDRAFT_960936 [Scleroderma citrinum Foug A]
MNDSVMMSSSRNPLMIYQILPDLLRTADLMSNRNTPLISASFEAKRLYSELSICIYVIREIEAPYCRFNYRSI